MIKAIIFDCFGVLTGDKWKEFVASLPDDQQEPARELNRALDRGNIDQKDFTDAVSELTHKPASEIAAAINEDNDKNHALIEHIRELKSSGLKIAILSNVSTDWIQTTFLTPAEMKLFDAFVLSYQVGMVKPDPAIYKLAAQRLNQQPSECLFIDDGERNVLAAERVGMKALLYENTAQLRKTISHLTKSE